MRLYKRLLLLKVARVSIQPFLQVFGDISRIIIVLLDGGVRYGEQS